MDSKAITKFNLQINFVIYQHYISIEIFIQPGENLLLVSYLINATLRL